MRSRHGPKRRHAISLVVALIAGNTEPSVRVQHPNGKLDLLLVGFAVFQTNLREELDGLFDASDGLPPELSGRQVLNVRVNGNLAPGVQVDAKVLHDRENLRDWRYFARVSGEHSDVAIGELPGAFADTLFTRYDTPFYGLQAHADQGPLDVRAFATESSGNRRVDRLRGTNLSGPYVLSASPVLEGSERVVIEVRDRRDPERIVHSNALVPRRDYLLDYLTGTLQFQEPIETETFDGDPVQIVVEYQFVAREGGSIEVLTGSRVGIRLAEGITLGTTYLRSTAGGTDPLSRGVIGIDQSIALGKRFTIATELAGTEGRFLDRREGAVDVTTRLKPTGSIEISAHLRRVGADLPTAADPRLESDLDRQHFEVKTAFLPTERQRVEVGYDTRSDNVGHDPEVTSLRMNSLFASWQGRVGELPKLGIRAERRTTENGSGMGVVRLAQIDVDDDDLARVKLLGKLALRAQYRYETESHDAAQAGGVATATARHNAKVRLAAEVHPSLVLSLEGRQMIGGREAREVVAGAKWVVKRDLSAGLSLRHRRDGTDPATASSATAALFDLRWEPNERLHGALKYEWSLRRQSDDESLARNLFGHLTVVPIVGFTATVAYKLDDRGGDGSGDSTLDGEYVATARFDRIPGMSLFVRVERGFRDERLLPFEGTRSERRTLLGGLTYELSKHWSLLFQLKREWLIQPVAARREATVFELSRELSRYLRLGAGFELTLDEQGEASRLDRSRFYVKLVGRL